MSQSFFSALLELIGLPDSENSGCGGYVQLVLYAENAEQFREQSFAFMNDYGWQVVNCGEIKQATAAPDSIIIHRFPLN